MFGGKIEQWIDWLKPGIIVVWVAVLIGLLIRVYRYLHPKDRTDLPSALEITDAGTLRLFHGQEMYAEVPLSQIASLKDAMVEVLPWNTINVSQLMLAAPISGVDHIYVLPYLDGYSDFILKLIDRSPDLHFEHEAVEWGSLSGRRLDLGVMRIAIYAFLGIVFCVAFAIGLMRGHGNVGVLWVLCGIETALIVWLVEGVKELRRSVTLVSFYPDKMQVVRSSIWYADVRPGKVPERCMVRTANGEYVLYSEYMKSYPMLTRRIGVFMGQGTDSDAGG